MFGQGFERLNTRDQFSIFLGMIVVGVTIGYFAGWAPFQQTYTTLSAQVHAQQKTLAWIQQAAIEVQQLRTQSSSTKHTANTQSVLSLVDKSIAKSVLAKANRRIEPKDGQTVQVSFEKVSFTQLLTWLGQLDQQHQMQVKTLSVTRQTPADLVNARLTLHHL
jgi:general secretion pathway protein M